MSDKTGTSGPALDGAALLRPPDAAAPSPPSDDTITDRIMASGLVGIGVACVLGVVLGVALGRENLQGLLMLVTTIIGVMGGFISKTMKQAK